MSHTPGPWYVVTGPPNGVAVHWSLDGQICPLRWTDGLRPDVEARVMADARLIAAAPELLAALRECLEQLVAYEEQRWLGDGPADAGRPDIKAARAAIAKAEAGG